MNKKPFAHVKGILFDLDGVVHVGDTPIPGAVDTLEFLRDQHISFRFVTNTTTQSPENLYGRMKKMRLPITQDAILTTHRVAAEHLIQLGSPPCYLLVADNALPAYDANPATKSNAYFFNGDLSPKSGFCLGQEEVLVAVD